MYADLSKMYRNCDQLTYCNWCSYDHDCDQSVQPVVVTTVTNHGQELIYEVALVVSRGLP